MFKIPRGTRDFNPGEMEKLRYVEESIRSTFKSYGYKEIQTPMFETLELFTAKSGNAIIDEIYAFNDKGGRNLALRPELTAPVIRFYVDKLQMKPKPLKLFYFGNCFRYDRPQKGRYREFKQAGCELIGTDTPEAIAELIAMAYHILKNIGLKNIIVNIGNLNLLSKIFDKLDLSKEQQKYLIPLIDKSLFEDVLDALADFGKKNEDSVKFIDAIQTTEFDILKNYIGNNEKAVKEILKIKNIFDFLKNSFNMNNFQLKLDIVRGLDYYKGIVFEIEAPLLGAEKQICGGGSYELLSLFGGKETPTSGFAIGLDRSIVALESENYNFLEPKIDVFIIPINDEIIQKSIEIAQILRDESYKVDIDLLKRGISKSLKYASSINAEKVIIVGPDELELDSVTIRDMESGKQKMVKIKNIKTIFN